MQPEGVWLQKNAPLSYLAERTTCQLPNPSEKIRGKTMTDLRRSMIIAHRGNIDRYCRLLAIQLTSNERQYLHKRIAEERVELEHWEMARADSAPQSEPAEPPR